MKKKTHKNLLFLIWLSTYFTGGCLFAAINGFDGIDHSIRYDAPESNFVELSTDEKVLLAEEARWNKGETSNAQIIHLKPLYQSNHQMPLTIVMNSKNLWQKNKVLQMVERTQELFKQCDLALSPVTIVQIDHPMFNAVECSNDYLITKDLPKGKNRPMAIFKGGPQCANGPSYANRHFYPDHPYEVESYGTVFMEIQLLSWELKKPDFFYGALAHELMHLLLEEGHNFIPGNVLSMNLDTRGKSISSEQCAKMLTNPFVKNN
jgi:hypothetical protein